MCGILVLLASFWNDFRLAKLCNFAARCTLGVTALLMWYEGAIKNQKVMESNQCYYNSISFKLELSKHAHRGQNLQSVFDFKHNALLSLILFPQAERPHQTDLWSAVRN